MSDFANQWADAKQKFETDTKMKKPSDMGKVFGINYRKGSGIDSELKTLDKLMAGFNGDALPSRTIKAIASSQETLTKDADHYVQLLEKSIKEEKEKLGGKEASLIYRDLKILKATLLAIVASVKGELARITEIKKLEVEDISKAKSVTISTMRTLREGMERNTKGGLLLAQKLLKEPKATEFNTLVPTAARNITQSLNQYQKWTMPETLPIDTLQSRNRAMQDEQIYQEVEKLYHEVSEFKQRVANLVKIEGDSPFNATLGRMCNNNPPLLAVDASEQDVVRAVKQFIAQVKPVALLAQDMQKN